MSHFIQRIASYISNNQKNYNNLCIIVPNRRTGLFLRRELALIIKEPRFAPDIIPIKEIFLADQELIEAADIKLIFKLYKVYKKQTGRSEEFDEFYYWGEIMLKDFDYIDKYLIDSSQLFSNIKDLKEIESRFDEFDVDELKIITTFWENINQAKISEHKTKFLDLWNKMHSVYSEFKNLLRKEGIAYEGMIYRDFIDNISFFNPDKETYCFAGFNALNNAEHALFKHLKQNTQTIFFWDADKYYIDDNIQEAGLFIRENIKKYPHPIDFNISDAIKNNKTDIELIISPSETAQTKLVPGILEEWIKKEDFVPEKTAVILADENLLMPLLYSIPPQLSEYNISMGYPVRNSSAYSFVIHLCGLQRNAVKTNDKSTVNHKDVINLLKHSYLRELFPSDCDKAEENIIKSKLIQIPVESLKGYNSVFAEIFNLNNADIQELTNYFSLIVSSMLYNIKTKTDLVLEAEFLRKISLNLNVFGDIIIKEGIDIKDNNTVFRLIQNNISTLSVPFEGEPLKGLQIMGFLETRSLDFDRIIMLSINEGKFPKKTIPQSIIPYKLRQTFGLPSIEYQDSIFAYYFYRLFHCAKEVKIIYSAQAQDGQGEASRFISQLKYELGQDKSTTTAYKINTLKIPELKVKKTASIIAKINSNLQKGISPTEINTYLNCSLMYYFKYVERIRKPDRTEDLDDAAFFGNLYHDTMRRLYDEYKGKVLNEEDFNKIADRDLIKKKVAEAIENEIPGASDKTSSNDNSVISEVIQRYVELSLDYDKEQVPFTIISLEERYSVDIKDINDSNIALCKISGLIDRVDLKDGVFRVLDYKTGKVVSKANSFESLFETDRKIELNAITQVLLYALMFDKTEDNHVCPGLLSISEIISRPDYKLNINKQSFNGFDNESRKLFISLLSEKIYELRNSDIDFVQTITEDNCKYCDYKLICMK
jgi:CRISPR/Cas system-associated exonuclease Cas4 (RecB family)